MESLINSDFVDELYPASALHPSDPIEKAKGRLLVKFGKITGPYYRCLFATAKLQPEEAKQARQKCWEEILATLTDMDQELGRRGTRFFGGDNVGMTDLMVWPWLER